MFRRFVRHIKEGFLGVGRHFPLALSSATTVTITLTIVGVFAILAANLSYLTQEIEQSISLVAMIDYKIVDKQTIDSIQTDIKNMSEVDTIEYRTKDEEFDFYNEQYPEMKEFSEIYRDDNPFHDAIIVYLVDGANLGIVKDKISKMDGISSVEDGGTNTYTLIDILHKARYIGLFLIGSLIILATYLIYNTIKVTIAARSDEISIMRYVGARNGYIRAPFLVEGIIIGIMGSIIPIGLIVYGYYELFNKTNGVVAGVLSLIPFYPLILYACLALLIIGVIVGFIGSYISVCKYLRLTR